MAKSFNQIYTESKETVYNKKENILVLLARLSTAVNFDPILAPGGKLDASTTQYNVQRRKRPTVNTVANANAGTTTSALAALDQFTKADWATLPVATGALRSVGFKETIADDYDYTLTPQHGKDMEYTVGEIAVARVKTLTELLLSAKDAVTGGTAGELPAYVKDETNVWDALSDQVILLGAVDDEFKDVQEASSFITFVSSTVAKELAKEMGETFNCEAPIAQTGFKTGMQVNGTPVVVTQRLKNREVVTMHNESLGFKSIEVSKAVAIDLGLVSFTGKFFFDVFSIIDAARMSKFSTSAAAPAPSVGSAFDAKSFKGDVMSVTADQRKLLKTALGLAGNVSNADLQSAVYAK